MFDFTRPYYFAMLARMCDVDLFVVPTLKQVAAPNLVCGKDAEVILNVPFGLDHSGNTHKIISQILPLGLVR